MDRRKKTIFTKRVVERWSRLPGEVVCSVTVPGGI